MHPIYSTLKHKSNFFILYSLYSFAFKNTHLYTLSKFWPDISMRKIQAICWDWLFVALFPTSSPIHFYACQTQNLCVLICCRKNNDHCFGVFNRQQFYLQDVHKRCTVNYREFVAKKTIKYWNKRILSNVLLPSYLGTCVKKSYKNK
jgi:hypothetical protein